MRVAARPPIVRHVDVGRALEQLPPAHARAVALWSAGASTDRIAVELGVPEDAVPPMVEIALAKLTSVLRAAITSPAGAPR